MTEIVFCATMRAQRTAHDDATLSCVTPMRASSQSCRFSVASASLHWHGVTHREHKARNGEV